MIQNFDLVAGHGISYAKHKVDVLDKDNFLYAYTVTESDFFNKKVEKISYDLKFVAAADGGTTIKITAKFYTAGDTEVTPDLMAQIKEASERRALVLKAVESYVLANPDA